VTFRNPNAPASANQIRYLRDLLRGRVSKDPGFPGRCEAKIRSGMTMQEIGAAIDYMKKMPQKPDVPDEFDYRNTNVKPRFKPDTAMAARTARLATPTPLAHAGTNVAQASHPTFAPPPVGVTAGVFERPDGKIYVVKPNRQGTRSYAKRMIPISAERLNLLGDRVKFEFEYEKGAIYGLTEQMRMPEDKVKELCLKYGRCIMCNHPLKAATSVERMIGPVCFKRVQGLQP
jgi:hypothetical protein